MFLSAALNTHLGFLLPVLCGAGFVQIAAVGVGNEATLKRYYNHGGSIVLVADNPAYTPQVYPAGTDVKIYGLAVGFVRVW